MSRRRRYSNERILEIVKLGRISGGDIQEVRREFKRRHGFMPSYSTVQRYFSRYGVREFNKRL